MLKEANPRAELVKDLKEENKDMMKKYNHLVDTNVKMLGDDYFVQKIKDGYDIPVEIYSTSHSRSCKIIYAFIAEQIKKKQQV